MNLMKPVGNEKGNITIEASIVIPIAILGITAFIYMGLIIYERSLLQSAADRAVEMGAAVWNRPDADVSTGRTVMDDLGRQGLYRRIYQPGKDGRLREIEDYARNIINVKRLLEPENSVVMAEINVYAVYSRLEVVVENGYRLPVGRFLGLFGADDTFTLKVEAWAVIDDPSELIRNADFIIDIEKELEDKYPGLKSFSEKTQDVFRDIKGKITGFLD